MSGLGRRSHYRKHLTESILTSLPEPTQTERIGRVKGSRGGNIIELEFKSSVGREGVTSSLALLPTKFNKLVWVKRGDYVIAEGAANSLDVVEGEKDKGKDVDVIEEGGDVPVCDGNAVVQPSATPPKKGEAVGWIIKHILFEEQVKHLRKIGTWPWGGGAANFNNFIIRVL